MNISQKRKLMEAIDTLSKKPGSATLETIEDALSGFKELIKHTTNNQIKVVYLVGGKNEKH